MVNFKPEKDLQPPNSGEEFAFPFPPYEIQLDFMKSLYGVLQSGGIGIFESPTGTGKSLSLTCGSLTWLKDFERLLEEELGSKIAQLRTEIAALEKENEVASDWITGQYNAMGQRKELGELLLCKTALEEYKKRLQAMKEKATVLKKRWSTAKDGDGALKTEPWQQDVIADEDEFLIADDSDSDDSGDERRESEKEPDRYRPVQIVFCSRTHSQLSQVVGEVKGTQHAKELRLASLASRQSLCINPDVRKLKSNTLINERCLELLKKGGKGKAVNEGGEENSGTKKRRKIAQSCPYYNQRAIEGLKNGTLFEVPDIEDLVKAGKREKACPYYASRAAVPDAQLLMVPYQLILHRRTRQQSGIDLHGSILIIDEAHNLLDTIAAIHSQELTHEQLQQVKMQLAAYKARYFARFSTKNLLRINQLIFIATRLGKLLSPDVKHNAASEQSTGTNVRSSRMIQTQDLLLETDTFNLDFTEIIAFCERSRIAQKVHGFAQSAPPEILAQSAAPAINRPKVGSTSKEVTSSMKSLLKSLEEKQKQKKLQSQKKLREKRSENEASEQENVKESSQKMVSNVIRPLINFIECLIEGNSGDGRVLLSYNVKEPVQSSMKFLLLNPGARFEEIVQSCRSVVLAGGTMKPTEELTEQVFRNCPERVTIKSYPHVVPPDAVLPIALARGPSGKDFLFNYANRQCQQLLDELQSTLMNLCYVVPNGIVAFFSSYEYLEQFCKRLEDSGNRARMEERKRIFREPRTTGQVERILSEYAQAAKSTTGALLLSVVGGKLSEGLNFSDELGRCVVVIGLPYPNRTSPELVERMRYLDRTLAKQSPTANTAGNEYYENLCMKAVNQCIGRAVRHIRDYAAVVLLDVRYCTGTESSIRRKLPSWISDQMVCADRYGQAHGSLVKFFRDHKTERTKEAQVSQ
ncbi:regulator of telomere elongation helicase 1 rtel1 [Anopheles darlingi]|uniref:DNA 5'-3' helicase n=1 Tax=Anopheles darlingi TaxID=43151 RepID=W5J2L8_ANODA|nr:regulator of telomere elongation helicase 1 rtel1 [Anopheles darlingi]